MSAETLWRKLRTEPLRSGATLVRVVDEFETRFDEYLQSNFANIGPNEVSKRMQPSALRTTNSVTYVDWPLAEPLSLTFNKRYAASRLIVQIAGSYYVNATGYVADIGVRINGVDNDMWHMLHNVVSSHTPFTAISNPIVGVPAGSYTVTMRAKVSNVALVMSVDNDQNSMSVREVS